MSSSPIFRPLPAPAARTLAGLSVSLRLRLLVAALITVTLCSVLLLGLNAREAAANRVVHQRVEHTLAITGGAERAKDALITMRKRLAMILIGSASEMTELQMRSLIDAEQQQVAAGAALLDPIDAPVAARLRSTAAAFAATARNGHAALLTGNTAAGPQHATQLSPISTAAEDALDALLARQRSEMRLILKLAAVEQAHTQTQIRSLHALMLLLSIAAASIILLALFRPLQRLYAGLRAIASGASLAAPPVTGEDEFGQLGTALYELSQLTTQLNALAFSDSLTTLPNRTQFEHDLVGLLHRVSPFSVVFADVDHFRTINDGYGYLFGDQAMKAVASRLQGLMRSNTRLYRYSGDLFAVVIEAEPPTAGSSDPAAFRLQLASEAERLRSRMVEPLAVEARSLTLCLSIGVAMFPDDGSTAEALVSAADAAMFSAKQSGRNAVQFARSDSALKARRRLELADDLRHALKTGAVTPHFQPIIDLRSGSLVCAEALARWRHPQRGFVPPDEFISIAEDSGQIDALTEHLLRIACATAVQWQGHPGRPAPRLAFNLSPRQVRQGVVEMVSGVLAETGLPTSQLEIEITESAIIERPETAERLLLELKGLGVSVALDDFGTGYSSLSYLMRFPIDKIKIDRSFVSHLTDQKQAGKIVAATISLAASLEITLVAEGVETVGQMVTLYELGCRQQQGWLFSKALPAAEFSLWAGQAPLRLDAVIRAQAEPANDLQSVA